MLEALIQTRQAEVDAAHRNGERAVAMAAALVEPLEELLEPLKQLSDFTVSADGPVVAVWFDRLVDGAIEPRFELSVSCDRLLNVDARMIASANPGKHPAIGYSLDIDAPTLADRVLHHSNKDFQRLISLWIQ